MRKKKNLLASLQAKLMYETSLANKRTIHHVFFDYSGHVNLLDVRVYYGGWKTEESSKKVLYKFNPTIKDLKEAIKKIKSLK